MSDRMTSPATASAISSLAWEGGLTPPDWPDGLTIENCGRAPVLASLSAPRLVGARWVWTIAPSISGRSGFASSLQERLVSSLVSRWRQRATGLIRCASTWKGWDTKQQRLFSQLAVSASTMKDGGCTLRATPTETANQNCASMRKWPGCRDLEVSPEEWARRMGYPLEWLSLAPLETRSSLKSRPSS